MSWLRHRAIKKFIENPDAFLVVNPRFCEHSYRLVFHSKLKKNIYYCHKCNKILNHSRSGEITNKKYWECPECLSLYSAKTNFCNICLGYTKPVKPLTNR